MPQNVRDMYVSLQLTTKAKLLRIIIQAREDLMRTNRIDGPPPTRISPKHAIAKAIDMDIEEIRNLTSNDCNQLRAIMTACLPLNSELQPRNIRELPALDLALAAANWKIQAAI